MNKIWIWVLVIVALLVGAYIGYAYEKNKFVTLMSNMQASYQNQLEQARKSAQKTQPTPVASNIVMMSKNGKLVTDANGRSLYTYDKDTTGKSNCTGTCATIWPPYLAKGNVSSPMPANLGTTIRSDGSTQYTLNGKPLYYYANDKNPGDTKGDGIGGIWHLAK